MIREVRKQVEEDLARLDKQLGRADNTDTQAERIVAAIRELVLPSAPNVPDEVMEHLYFSLVRRVVVHVGSVFRSDPIAAVLGGQTVQRPTLR
jgi:hypothetical protein